MEPGQHVQLPKERHVPAGCTGFGVRLELLHKRHKHAVVQEKIADPVMSSKGEQTEAAPCAPLLVPR